MQIFESLRNNFLKFEIKILFPTKTNMLIPNLDPKLSKNNNNTEFFQFHSYLQWKKIDFATVNVASIHGLSFIRVCIRKWKWWIPSIWSGVNAYIKGSPPLMIQYDLFSLTVISWRFLFYTSHFSCLTNGKTYNFIGYKTRKCEV